MSLFLSSKLLMLDSFCGCSCSAPAVFVSIRRLHGQSVSLFIVLFFCTFIQEKIGDSAAKV